ncbi:MAG: hypothetical protein NUV91_08420 [Candidatus Omnitrophica bacterium]|nr:hypothetical protein [Candidatus Omnitrophota bacterium]
MRNFYLAVILVFLASTSSQASDSRLLNWIRENRSFKTQMPFSFQIPNDRQDLYKEMGQVDHVEGIIERHIVREGIVIYDAALWQIVLTRLGQKTDLKLAETPTKIYWDGHLGDLSNVRAGYPDQPYIYDMADPMRVSSHLSQKGQRGFIFRILNANGRYQASDPLDEKTHLDGFPNGDQLHWEDWKPIAGENAWVVIGALHLYHQKYFNLNRGEYVAPRNTIELKLAEELARAAMILQAENGGIRMAPLGTFYNPYVDENGQLTITHEERLTLLPDLSGSKIVELVLGKQPPPEKYSWHYYEISTENTLSWHAAFRMLYRITRKIEYQQAMERIEGYLRDVWNEKENVLDQGMHFTDGKWQPNQKYFATDVQYLALMVIGPSRLERWFGGGAPLKIWQATKKKSGVFERGILLGLGYTQEHDRISLEWTAASLLALDMLRDHYRTSQPQLVKEIHKDRDSMRQAMEKYRYQVDEDESAYSYSSRRGWIPFGWFSHDPEVLSLASTCWVLLVDEGVNPLVLEK